MMSGSQQPMGALVLTNRASPAYREGCEAVVPYLDHLGVPYTLLDLAHSSLPTDVSDYALVIIAHHHLDAKGNRLLASDRQALLSAVRAGTGLVSFDPSFPRLGEVSHSTRKETTRAESVEFVGRPHYITARHTTGQKLPLAGTLPVPALDAPDKGVLVAAGGQPLLAATALGRGRVVQWATARWMHSSVLGPLGGLDDVLWRSLVWAARKPFALRGLAPLVTMRVDDTAALGDLWQQSPLYWVHIANQHGFKPWLGLFIYNLSEPAVNELRDLIQHGQATASPHAFGRPPGVAGWYYYRQGMPLRAGSCDRFIGRGQGRPWPADFDEFIYFDHQRGHRWPDDEAIRGLAAVDEWYAAHAPLPMSRYLCPHFDEIGKNTIAHVHDRWGTEFSCMVQDVNRPYGSDSTWLKAGPFRRYEKPGTGFIELARRGQRPVYYADFVNLGGRQFFNCITEIRDDAGYEWRPDNDIAATVSRGVRQLRRALDSMALAVLFTHETDHIYEIRPEAWAAEVAQVSKGIADYSPIYVTLDEGMRYVRATQTSRLISCRHDLSAGEVAARFTGYADTPTHFYLFSESGDTINARLVDVPAFEGEVVVAMPIKG